MCERRQTLSVSKDNGTSTGRPHLIFGWHLGTWHMVLGCLVALVGIFGAAITSGAVVGNVILDREWSERMERFHDDAVPEITGLIQREVKTAIDAHNVEAMSAYNVDKLALAARLAGLETHANDTDTRLQRMEDMLWALYSSRFGNTPPPRSPTRCWRFAMSSPPTNPRPRS